jgi:hypothetical protein
MIGDLVRKPCPKNAGIRTYLHDTFVLVYCKLFELEIRVGHLQIAI